MLKSSIENRSVEHNQNRRRSSSLSISSSEKNHSSHVMITSKYFSGPVDHLSIENKGEENVSPINNSPEIRKKQQHSLEKTRTSINIRDITSTKEDKQNHNQIMSSDDEFDNDSELLNTLAQLHGLAYIPRLPPDINQVTNETDLSPKKIQDEPHKSNNIQSLMFNSNEEEKKNIRLSDNGNEKDKKHDERIKENLARHSSLTSLASSLFNNEESQSSDIILDSDESSSLTMSTNELNNSFLYSKQLIIHNFHIKNRTYDKFFELTTTRESDDLNSNDPWKQSTSHKIPSDRESLFREDTDDNDLTDYLYWIIDHLNDDLSPSTEIKSTQNLENTIQDNDLIHPVINMIHHDSFSNNEFQPSVISQEGNHQKKEMISSFDMDVVRLVEKLVSNALQSVLDETNDSKRQTEQVVNRNLSQSISPVNKENSNLSIANLILIIKWHNQTNMQSFNRSNQKFDNTWMKYFEISNDISRQISIHSISVYSTTFDISNLSSSLSQQVNHIEAKNSTSLSPNLYDSTVMTNNSMKSSLTTFGTNINFNDDSSFQDDFIRNEVI